MDNETRAAPKDGNGETIPDAPAKGTSTQVDSLLVAPLQRGELIGRYLVVSKLGEGSMGVVYAAYDPDLDRRVAIKLMRLADPAGAEGRLAQEARAMARLSHRNVVAIYDVGTVKDRMFMTMELVEGINLKQWMKETTRTWSETLQTYLYAGRGLAAAHAGGLVHRDFKPANVLVGNDGRILVGDFGLARSQEAAAIGDAGPWTSGTPAYMAPEQHEGRPLDGRADQFSFCVALYEGLYGERPFVGDSPLAVRAAMVTGRVQPPPAATASTVPSWLRAAVLKGLHPDPQQRYPNMDALIQTLGADPRRALKRRAAIVAGTVGVVLVGALAVHASRAERVRCTTEAARQVEVWSPERKERAHLAFTASQSPVADDAWQRVSERLTDYASGWATQWTALCEDDAHARTDTARLERDCLVSRLQELGALTDIFTSADRQVVDRATRAVSDLTPLNRCRAAPPPAMTLTPESQTPLRAALVRGRVLEGAGKAQEARAVFNEVLSASKGPGMEPLRAEALEAEAVLEYYYLPNARSLAERVEMARSAAELAEAARQDEVAARARLSVLHFLTEGPPPYAEADEAGGEATAAIQRLGSPPDLQAQLDKLLGGLAQYEGRFDDASRLMRSSVAAMEAAGQGEDLALASPLDYLGDLLRDEGRYDEALVHLRRALALQEHALGPHHPDLTATLTYLGEVLSNQGQWTEAFASLERARLLEEGAGNTSDMATVLTDESIVQRNQGHVTEARALCQRALALPGLEGLELASAQGEMGLVELADHHARLAIPWLEKGLAIRGQRPGDRTDVAELRFGLTKALALTDGDLTRAIALAQKAREAYAKGGQADRGPLREVDTWLASVARP